MFRPGESLKPDSWEFTVGRGDLKIPTLAWRDRGGTSNIADFFRMFWAINSDDPYKFFDIYNRFDEKSLKGGVEIVIPPEADKPLLVVRGIYNPAIKIPSYDIANFYHHKGTEQHQILSMPASAGPFEEVVGLTSSHGISYWDGRVLGECFGEDHFWDVDVEKDRLYEQSLKEILAGTIELLAAS